MVYFFSEIWFLKNISRGLFFFNLILSKNYRKLIDLRWLENLGAQGLGKEVEKFILKNLIILNFYGLKFYLIVIILLIVILLI